MVRLTGKKRYANRKGFFKIDEEYKTEAEAKRMAKFLSPHKNKGEYMKIERHRAKPKNYNGGSGPRIIGFARIPKLQFKRIRFRGF